MVTKVSCYGENELETERCGWPIKLVDLDAQVDHLALVKIMVYGVNLPNRTLVSSNWSLAIEHPPSQQRPSELGTIENVCTEEQQTRKRLGTSTKSSPPGQ